VVDGGGGWRWQVVAVRGLAAAGSGRRHSAPLGTVRVRARVRAGAAVCERDHAKQ